MNKKYTLEQILDSLIGHTKDNTYKPICDELRELGFEIEIIGGKDENI